MGIVFIWTQVGGSFGIVGNLAVGQRHANEVAVSIVVHLSFVMTFLADQVKRLSAAALLRPNAFNTLLLLQEFF